MLLIHLPPIDYEAQRIVLTAILGAVWVWSVVELILILANPSRSLPLKIQPKLSVLRAASSGDGVGESGLSIDKAGASV